MKILHITAHMGAGAGKAIAGIVISDHEHEHKIIVVQEPKKRNHIESCLREGIEVLVSPAVEELIRNVEWSDVIVINWWHHPSIFEILLRISDMKTRIVIWNHVNGLNYPRLKGDFLYEFDGCMFTSGASYKNSLWTKGQAKAIKEKSTLVYGMGDFRPEEYISKEDYSLDKEVRIGYVGSLDYAKLHPSFISWIKKALEADETIRFLIAGDPTEDIVNDVKEMGTEKIELLGFQSNVNEVLLSCDIFIYPLNPMNFATTENAILEAMAVGLPIITTDGIVEQNIIDNGVNGVLVHNAEEFVGSIKKLIEDMGLRKQLGKSARSYVIEKYGISENVENYRQAINKMVSVTKHKHDFTSVIGMRSYEWFLSGCDSFERRVFEDALKCEKGTKEYEKSVKRIKELGQIFNGKEKGSVNQFSYMYPDDKDLSKLVEMVNYEV